MIDVIDPTPCRLAGGCFLMWCMIAYRAETRMMAPVIAAQGTKPNARRLLRALLTSDANIIPEPAQGILRVQLPGLRSDACDRMLLAVFKLTHYPREAPGGTGRQGIIHRNGGLRRVAGYRKRRYSTAPYASWMASAA